MAMVWVVEYGEVMQAFKNEVNAKKYFKHELQKAWDDCIKQSIPKGECYDDNYFTYSQCLKYGYAKINGKEYRITPILVVDN